MLSTPRGRVRSVTKVANKKILSASGGFRRVVQAQDQIGGLRFEDDESAIRAHGHPLVCGCVGPASIRREINSIALSGTAGSSHTSVSDKNISMRAVRHYISCRGEERDVSPIGAYRRRRTRSVSGTTRRTHGGHLGESGTARRVVEIHGR